MQASAGGGEDNRVARAITLVDRRRAAILSRPSMATALALSLIVPAYNEARRLPPTLERLRDYLDSSDEPYEVIVVDDGSDDGTATEAQRMADRWPQLEVVRLPVNTGKGAAVREGMLRARGVHRVFSDADLSTPIEELPRLRARLDSVCQVAIASRDLPDSDIQIRQPAWREFMGRTYNRLLRLLVLPGIRDTQCGFKVFTAEAAEACFEPLETFRFGFDAEVLVRAHRRGWKIAEVPVRWRHVEESRVGGIGDALRMLYDLVRLRFTRF
jgi:dolichyl-phosphate beta-glucosyltransferase